MYLYEILSEQIKMMAVKVQDFFHKSKNRISSTCQRSLFFECVYYGITRKYQRTVVVCVIFISNEPS